MIVSSLFIRQFCVIDDNKIKRAEIHKREYVKKR